MKTIKRRHVTRKDFNNFEKKLDAAVAGAANKAVLSSEGVSKMSEEALVNLKAYLDSRFDKVTVIGYVRPPVSYMQSLFQQGIRTGRRKSLQVGVRYKQRLQAIDRVFGRGNVRLFTFDRTTLLNGDVVQDFVHQIGHTIPPDAVMRANESISLETLAVLLMRNAYGENIAPQRASALVEGFQDLGRSKLKFHSDFAQPVLDRRRDDLEWTADRLQTSFLDKATHAADAIKSEEQLRLIALAQEAAVLALLDSEIGQLDDGNPYADEAARVLRLDDRTTRLVAATDLLGMIWQAKGRGGGLKIGTPT